MGHAGGAEHCHRESEREREGGGGIERGVEREVRQPLNPNFEVLVPLSDSIC